VVPERHAGGQAARGAHLLVSAGGGIVGAALFQTVLQARALLRDPALPLRIVAGPFLPELAWQSLQTLVRGQPGVQLLRQVPDMVAEMRGARASLSQCGYNTALDILVAGVPALVVPYATKTENEQSERATRLAELGAMQQLDPAALDAPRLAAAIDALLAFTPSATALGLDGARTTARLLLELVQSGATTVPRSPACTPA
jgi:predicted glycosyltransferase